MNTALSRVSSYLILNSSALPSFISPLLISIFPLTFSPAREEVPVTSKVVPNISPKRVLEAPKSIDVEFGIKLLPSFAPIVTVSELLLPIVVSP